MIMTPTKAANTIKRAMRYHRDRHFRLIASMGRHHVSRDVIMAQLCVYRYTDDYNGCAASMGCDMELMDLPTIATNAEWITHDTRIKQDMKRLADIAEFWMNQGLTSKSVLRCVYGEMSKVELQVYTGWNHEVDESRMAYPPRYEPYVKRIHHL